MLRSLRFLGLSLIALMFLAGCRREDAAAVPTLAIPAPTVVVGQTPVTSPTIFASPTIAVSPSTPTALPPTATATVAPATPVVATTTPLPSAVPPSPTPVQSFPGPTRISFAPGATSAVVSDVLIAGGDTNAYLVRAQAGQVLTVQVASTAPGAAQVAIRDLTGGVLASGTDLAAVSAALPASADYAVDLSTATGSAAVNYTMTVSIPPSSGQPPQPERISFAPGATSATVNGVLPAGGGLRRYVLRVLAGQELTANLSGNPFGWSTVFIRDAAGAVLASGTEGGAGLSVRVPADGDYFVDVGSGVGAPVVGYSLTVSVPVLAPPPVQPVRLQFPPGGISVSTAGTLSAGGARAAYVVRVGAGQTMIVNLSGNPPGQIDAFVRAAAGQTLNFGKDPTSLAVTIPVDGDYFIELSTPTNTAAVTYNLEVVAPPLPDAGQPGRITFAPGATSATVNGALVAGGASNTWLLRAVAGQTMTVSLAPSEYGWITINVYDPLNQLIGTGLDGTGVAAPLNTDGDYSIVITSNGATAPALNYAMTVTIP